MALTARHSRGNRVTAATTTVAARAWQVARPCCRSGDRPLGLRSCASCWTCRSSSLPAAIRRPEANGVNAAPHRSSAVPRRRARPEVPSSSAIVFAMVASSCQRIACAAPSSRGEVSRPRGSRSRRRYPTALRPNRPRRRVASAPEVLSSRRCGPGARTLRAPPGSQGRGCGARGAQSRRTRSCRPRRGRACCRRPAADAAATSGWLRSGPGAVGHRRVSACSSPSSWTRRHRASGTRSRPRSRAPTRCRAPRRARESRDGSMPRTRSGYGRGLEGGSRPARPRWG